MINPYQFVMGYRLDALYDHTKYSLSTPSAGGAGPNLSEPGGVQLALVSSPILSTPSLVVTSWPWCPASAGGAETDVGVPLRALVVY